MLRAVIALKSGQARPCVSSQEKIVLTLGATVRKSLLRTVAVGVKTTAVEK